MPPGKFGGYGLTGQELSKFENLSAKVGVQDAQPALVAARQVAARASATVGEAMLITAWSSQKLTLAAKRDRLNSCISKMEEQARSFKQEVKDLVCAELLETVMSWLLNN